MTPRPGRVLGVDPGTVRIGLAVTDPDRLVATPLDTVEGGEGAAARVADAAREHGCETVVVGLPKGLSGRDTDSTRMARALARELEGCGLAVELFDERLTSVQADRALDEAGTRGRARRAARDRIAATLLLQAWLDAQN